MRENVERRYAKGVWLKQELFVTIHRLVFRGETREDVSMELVLSDIK